MPRGIETAIIEFVRQLYDSVGWLGVFIALTIESAAIPLPSEVTLPLAGWLLVQDKGLPVSGVLIAGLIGALGNVVGSWITYWIGMVGGRPLLLKYGKYVLISPHHIELADKWFAEKGEATAFFSRLLPVVRTFISVPAGIARMNFLKFTIYTFIGSFIWCTALATGGYYTGKNWEQLRNAMRPFDYPIAAIVLILLVVFFVRGRRAGRHPAAVVAAPISDTSPGPRPMNGRRDLKWGAAPVVPPPPYAAQQQPQADASERLRDAWKPVSETAATTTPITTTTKSADPAAPQPSRGTPDTVPLGFYRPKTEEIQTKARNGKQSDRTTGK